MRATDVNLVVIGPGRVGLSLLAAARSAGIDAKAAGRGEELAAADIEGAAVLLCVPDSTIASACETVSRLGPRLVGHVSGATGLGALGSAAGIGSETFSLHPLQTFPGPDTDPSGIPCAVAGSTPAAVAYASALASALEMKPFEVPDDQRAAYHAAASIASNFLVALEEASVGLLDRAGIADGRRLLTPLVLATAGNWSSGGGDALTGPVARGDEATVAAQREAVEATWPELVEAFDAMVALTRLVAEGRPKDEDTGSS